MNVLLKACASLPEDGFLIQRIISGDESAFYAFYKKYARYVAGVAHRLLADNGEVDDVVQETFVTAFQKIKDLRTPEHARLWLAKIAVRRAQRRLTKCRFSSVFTKPPTETDDKLASCLDNLRDALGRIPQKLGEPWIMHQLEGWTIDEVASALDISSATVKRRIAAADTKIRSKIDVYD